MNSVKETLLRAVEADKESRYFEAQQLYEKSVKQLSDIAKMEESAGVKEKLYIRITEYMDRIQVIQNKLSASGLRVRHIDIEEDSMGHSYRSLFEDILEKTMKEALIQEPHLHERFQCENLIIFIELLVKNCPQLKYIQLITKVDPAKNEEQQRNMLETIQKDLRQWGITFHIKYEPKLHDRKIVLGHTYIIQAGRGLHIFKPRNSPLGLGLHEFDLRKCHKCEINIFKITN